jgi:hypothetical protein
MAQDDPIDIPEPRGAPSRAKPRRRRRTWPIFVGIVSAMLLAMAAVGWIVSALHREPPPPAVTANLALPPPAPEPAPPPKPPEPVTVDSVAPSDSYPLTDWTIEKASGGNIDGATFAGAQLDAETAPLLTDSDVIAVSGWAGDAGLGMRFSRVLISVCGRVVAAATADMPREDVAKSIHPNLTAPGWSVKLLVGHLPRCENATLSGWAVAPFGRILFPLHGELPLPLGPSRGIDPGLPVTGGVLIKPADAAPPPRIFIEIKGAGIDLRSCADTSCPAVGTLPHGKHEGIRLDTGTDWTLVVVPGRASGWVSDKAATVAAAP